jgi:hypothetical protein
VEDGVLSMEGVLNSRIKFGIRINLRRTGVGRCRLATSG